MGELGRIRLEPTDANPKVIQIAVNDKFIVALRSDGQILWKPHGDREPWYMIPTCPTGTPGSK